MKRALQVTLAILSLLPLTVSTLGLIFGVGLYVPDAAPAPNLDSQFRFMSGWDVGLALIVWWILPNVERHTGLFRVVCFGVFLGGVGRAAAWYFTGTPSLAFIVVTVLELLVPLFIPWQAYVARQAQLTPARE